jgi:hypothetical protein
MRFFSRKMRDSEVKNRAAKGGELTEGNPITLSKGLPDNYDFC